MKRICMLIFVLLLISLSGCSNKEVKKYNYYFEGENGDWKASMPYYAKEVFSTREQETFEYYNEVDSDLTVTYIGDQTDFTDIKYIEISCENLSAKCTQRVNYTDGPPTELSFIIYDAAGDSHILEKDDVITIKIDMNGEVQTLDLKDE